MNRYLTIHIPETAAPAPVSHFLRTQAGLTKKQISQAKFRPGGVQKKRTAVPGDGNCLSRGSDYGMSGNE